MAKYAANTEVNAETSQSEIKRILTRYGATRTLFYEEPQRAAIGFEFQGRQIRFVLPLPSKEEFRFTEVRRFARSDTETQKAWEQGCRQRWRALALAIKAKLEAVESSIATFEQEFLAYIVLPGGQTVGEFITPQLEEAYSTQTMPKMLPGIGETGLLN